jgi:hypothetical protein
VAFSFTLLLRPQPPQNRRANLPSPENQTPRAIVLLGYFLGDRWQVVSARIHHNLVLVTCVVAVLVVLYLVWRKYRAADKRG